MPEERGLCGLFFFRKYMSKCRHTHEYNLLGKRGSLKMQSSLRRSRTGVGQSLNSMTGVLVGRERCEERHRAGDWRVRPRRGDARGCRSRQMPGEARRNSPRASPQARAPADPLISDSGLWNRVRVSFRCFKSSVLWSFALAALGNQYEVVRKNSVF